MVSLADQRRRAEYLEDTHAVSERRACRVVGVARSTKRRPSGRIEEVTLLSEIPKLLGFRNLHTAVLISPAIERLL